MTPVTDTTFAFPQAWTGADFADVADVSYRLSPAHLAALTELLARVKRDGLALADIERSHFSHPALDGDFAGILEELLFGRGIVVLRGLPVHDYSAEDMAMVHWGIGTHFGKAVSQSALGDVLGQVTDQTKPGEAEEARGYTTSRELSLHNDLAQVVGMLCYRQAESGGVSVVANGLAIHNEIAEKHPDYLKILYRGFYYHRRGEEAPGVPEITPYRVPIFSSKAGHTSVFYVRGILENAYDVPGNTLSEQEVAALDCFDALAREHSYRLRLEPGDAMFMNNRTTLHARTKFTNGDAPDQRRHLMRLWLDTPGKRPDVKEIQIYENEGGRSGIDGQVGRIRAAAKYHVGNAAE